METLLNYLIRSMVVSGMLLGYYYGALRNRKIHSFNRLYLVMTLLAGAFLPLLRLPWLNWQRSGQTVQFTVHPAAHAALTGGFTPGAALLSAASLVSAALMFVLAWRIAGVLRLRRGCERVPVQGGFLIEVRDRRAPFSFLNNLFWQQGADIGEPANRKIFEHELAHIRGRHTYDSLLVNVLAAIFWVNPCYWLIRRELAMVHEFIADDASIGLNDTAGFATMLLQAYDNGRYLDPSHRFFHSPIKRRLIMITKSSGPAPLRKWLALPVLFAVMALSCSKEQSLPPSKSPELTLSKSATIKLLLKDSVDKSIAQKVKSFIFVTGRTAGKDTFFIRFNTAGDKQHVEKVFRPGGAPAGGPITITGYKLSGTGRAQDYQDPPPPLPSLEKQY